MLATDKARALLAVGLSSDAIAELDGAIAAFRRLRLDQDLAQAELTLAQAALAAGELTAARRWAVAARRRFRRQGNAACAHLTELILLRSRFAGPGRRPGPIAAQAELLAGRLRGCGLRNDADLAELLAARALVAAGRAAGARRRIAATRRRGPAASLEVGLLRQLAKAELAELEGQAADAGRAAGRAGPAPGPSKPSGQRRPADRGGRARRRPGGAACGRRWTAGPRRWSSPGWNVPARRRSGPGRCDRPPMRARRRSWPNCASSATSSATPS